MSPFSHCLFQVVVVEEVGLLPDPFRGMVARRPNSRATRQGLDHRQRWALGTLKVPTISELILCQKSNDGTDNGTILKK